MIFTKLQVLSSDEIEKILEASYQILERTGCRFEWPEAVRKAGPYPDPTFRGLKPEQLEGMYSARKYPEAKGDLRAVLLQCRRPELYAPRPEPKK